jgi:hypothetical protein
MSAGMPGPLPIIFSEDPGIDKQERRGKSRERADMLKILHRTQYEHDYIALWRNNSVVGGHSATSGCDMSSLMPSLEITRENKLNDMRSTSFMASPLVIADHKGAGNRVPHAVTNHTGFCKQYPSAATA